MHWQRVRQVRPKWLRLSVRERARDKRRRQLPVRKNKAEKRKENVTHVASESVARN